MDVGSGIFLEFSSIPQRDRKYSYTNFYIFAKTAITQDDCLTAGAWAVCAYNQTRETKINKSQAIKMWLPWQHKAAPK